MILGMIILQFIIALFFNKKVYSTFIRFGPRFPAMSKAYDADLIKTAQNLARNMGVENEVHTGGSFRFATKKKRELESVIDNNDDFFFANCSLYLSGWPKL
jgi:hypothetical protein